MQGILLAVRHLALAALFLRAFLPAGWMPDAQAGLVICSPITLGAVHHDGAPRDGTPGHADGKMTQEECPFAAAPHLASVPELPQLALPAFHAFAASIDRATATAIAARFTPQSPRAPPHIV